MKNYARLRGTLLAATGSLGVGLVLCHLAGFLPEDALIVAGAGVFGALVGLFSQNRSMTAGAVAFGLGALLSGVVTTVWFGGFRMPMAAMVVYILCAGALMVSGYGFYKPLGVWSVLLSGLGALVVRESFWSVTIGGLALAALVLTLDGFRDSGMRKSQLKTRDHKALDNPGGILEHSYFLGAVFLAGAVAVGLVTFGLSSLLVNSVKDAMTGSASGILAVFRWVGWAIEAFLQWISDLFPDLEESPGGGIGYDSDYTRETYWGAFGSWLATIIMVAVFVAACAGVCALAGMLFLKARKKPREETSQGDYEDEVESLERPKRSFFRKRHKAKQRYRDMATPALKIRFVFQQMLKKRTETEPLAVTKTPNELRTGECPDEATLVAAYNRVKYGNLEVSPQELLAAERYLNQI